MCARMAESKPSDFLVWLLGFYVFYCEGSSEEYLRDETFCDCWDTPFYVFPQNAILPPNDPGKANIFLHIKIRAKYLHWLPRWPESNFKMVAEVVADTSRCTWRSLECWCGWTYSWGVRCFLQKQSRICACVYSSVYCMMNCICLTFPSGCRTRHHCCLLTSDIARRKHLR